MVGFCAENNICAFLVTGLHLKRCGEEFQVAF